MGGGVRAAAFALLLVASLAPASVADHCETRIVVYGRIAFTPGLMPPATPASQVCFEFQSTNSAGHQLPPGSDQVFVRVEADLGPAYTKLKLTLDGLGWHDQEFRLDRVAASSGVFTYNIEDWLTIPDADHPDGELRATVRFPFNHDATVTYQLLSP